MDEEIFTLQEAFELAQQRPGNKIFSFECKKMKDRIGIKTQRNKNTKIEDYDLVRKYYVIDIEYFSDYYESILKIQPQNLRFHEIIRSDKPCRFYLDLEFENTVNPGVDGKKLTEYFLDYIFSQMEDYFQLVRPSCNDVLKLDSSTTDKFSHHVIVHLPDGKLFRNNATLGRFLKYCVRHLENMSRRQLIALGLENFFVVKAGDHKTTKTTMSTDLSNFCTDDEDDDDIVGRSKYQSRIPFCDLAVYGINKSMRMFLSRKFGENKKPFILAENCRFYEPESTNDILCRRILLDSLIEIAEPHLDEDLLLDFMDLEDSRKSSNRTMKAGKSLYYSDISLTARSLGKLELCDDSDTPELDKQIVNYLQDVLLFHNAEVSLGIGDYFQDAQRYPIYIRDRKITPDGRYLIFHFKNFNFCQNINRRHRSNHIKIVADLTRAVIYQKCYDADCIAFRSNFYPLERNHLLETEIERISKNLHSRYDRDNKNTIWRGFEGKCEDYDIEVILKPFSKLNVSSVT